jgi:putative flippase GtrA
MLFDRKLAKFIIVGIVNTLAGSAIMFGLYNLAGAGYWASSACNYVLTSVLSFFLNKYFTFGVKEWSAFMVFAFIANIIIAYLIAYGIAKPLAHYLLKTSNQQTRDNIAMLAGICLFTGVNYIGQRLVVFRSPDMKTEKE